MCNSGAIVSSNKFMRVGRNFAARYNCRLRSVDKLIFFPGGDNGGNKTDHAQYIFTQAEGSAGCEGQ